ncbi:neuropilin-2-like isoform X2 [Ostrea edulis]|uniref:neuropilin-2-like isoform X2 n=1 Tax=Ostrea edulis TaxID=37623 RepID=UPI0020944390|nr:neuropilin-2-like isoform X2 [Ostrea edulis]
MRKRGLQIPAFLLNFMVITGSAVHRTLTATGSSAYFSSPGYPNEYPSNLTLQTTILAATQTDVIHINFLDCDIEYARVKVPYCQIDQIMVYDGVSTNDSVLYQGCCLNDVTKLRSSGSSLLLRFISDSTVSGRGFYVQFYTNGTDTRSDNDLSSGSAIVIVIVLIVVFLASVGVILPLLYYKHKYPKFKVSHKILPKTSDNVKNTGPEVNLQKQPVAVASGSKSPNLLKSSSPGTSTPDSSINGRVPKQNLM